MSSTSVSSSTTTESPSSSPTGDGSGKGNSPASATILFGFLVIFVALFAAFLLLSFFWRYQRSRRGGDGALESDGSRGKHDLNRVPKMWEVWIQDDPSGGRWSWESVMPLSIDVDRASSERGISTAPHSRLRWPRNPFRRRPAPSPAPTQQQQQQHESGLGAEAQALISGMRMSFVIAMPQADAPNRRRSEISQASRADSWRRREYAIGTYHPPLWEGRML
ncbi:hypothetical protein F5148DRAFT_885550 [Russula earlei]|uniref:Uncharacterized protein n=1 Tax=Russula earlei TaxID=71964 RepID=A0ACC0UA83_9AGAM|nr:hypothetical protein F5148DRAFT_885550 [Russula earlei]